MLPPGVDNDCNAGPQMLPSPADDNADGLEGWAATLVQRELGSSCAPAAKRLHAIGAPARILCTAQSRAAGIGGLVTAITR